jgi:hypothetical protein
MYSNYGEAKICLKILVGFLKGRRYLIGSKSKQAVNIKMGFEEVFVNV